MEEGKQLNIWDFHGSDTFDEYDANDEYECITDVEEMNEFDEWIIKNKNKDDINFDSSYNDAIYKRYYNPKHITEEENLPEILYDASIGLALLDRYYVYSKRYFNWYICEEDRFIKREIQEAQDFKTEIEMVLEDRFSFDKELIPRYNDESMLMILYSFYERTLKLLADQEARNGYFNRRIFRSYEKKSFDLKCIDFINFMKHINIQYPQEYMKKLKDLRDIRNCLVHDAGRCDNRLEESLLEAYPDLLDDHHIALNEEYIKEAFSLIGNLFKYIESFYTGKPYEERFPSEAWVFE